MKAFQNSKAAYLFLFVITLAGFFIRIINVGGNPPGLTWDEASLGYNAYSILKTGADEYGNRFPLSIRSFDDYKPPAYVYLSVPFVALFGLNEISIRLLSVLAGTLLIPVVYFLVKELLRSEDGSQKSDKEVGSLTSAIPLLASLLIALSPWSIQLSRGAFEGNLGLFFFSLGVFLLLKGSRSSRLLVLSSIPFVLSMYSYHSFRMVVPLFLVCFSILYQKELRNHLQTVAVTGILFALLIIPIFFSLFLSEGAGSRLSMVTSFSNQELLEPSIKRLEQAQKTGDMLGMIINNRRVVYFRSTIEGYLDHFDPGYLFIHGDSGRHHHALDMGVLYLFELPFLIAGAVVLLRQRSRGVILLFLWLLIAPLPSAITTGTPHAIRAIAMMPMLHILSAVGLAGVMREIRERWVFLSSIILLLSVNVIYYFYQYFIQTPIAYADFWQSENRELYTYLQKEENNYDKIIVTYFYDQPYIYYLFYNNIDPAWYQGYWQHKGYLSAERMKRIIGKYEFRAINYSTDREEKKTLLVGSPDEIPSDADYTAITFPDGTDAYRIIGTN